jgi:hydrogenase expression/formation protein HypC
MCLAVPAKIVEIEDGVAICTVGDSPTKVTASITLLPEEPKIGEYLIVHAGFALQKLDTKEAEETLSIMRDMVRLADEAGVEQPTPIEDQFLAK